jgi:hypothetical protein
MLQKCKNSLKYNGTYCFSYFFDLLYPFKFIMKYLL